MRCGQVRGSIRLDTPNLQQIGRIDSLGNSCVYCYCVRVSTKVVLYWLKWFADKLNLGK